LGFTITSKIGARFTTGTGITVDGDYAVEARNDCDADGQNCRPSFTVKGTLVNATNTSIDEIIVEFDLYDNNNHYYDLASGTSIGGINTCRGYLASSANSRQPFDIDCSGGFMNSYICHNTASDNEYCKSFDSVAIVAKLAKVYRRWDCGMLDATTVCRNYEYFYRGK